MYVENTDGKYDEYFEAFKALTVGVAKLMARENGGDGPSDAEIEASWSVLLEIETKIAEVGAILYYFFI